VRTVCVFLSSSAGRPVDVAAITELARELAARDLTLIYGGAHRGLMGTLADAVLEAGGRAIGVIPQSLVEREIAHRGLTELHVVETMHQRKAMMFSLADAFVVAPGGLGTLEEAFEQLTGIDPAGRADLLAVFRKLGGSGKTVLISTHILHEIGEITDRVVLMARGRVLASGTVGSIRDLLEEHPLTLRITSNRARELAGDLIGIEEVVGVAVENGGGDLLLETVRGVRPMTEVLPDAFGPEDLAR